MTDVARDYDWERYETEWSPSDAYTQQEQLLGSIFQHLPTPGTILEVGPGLGRITRMALTQWPLAAYSAADVALAPLAEAQRLSGGLLHEFFGPLQADGALTAQAGYSIRQKENQAVWAAAQPQFELVLAIEVLMHVPPEEVGRAIQNLFAAVRERGNLVTCDWTQDYGDVPIRVQNYRHDYMTLFHRAGAQAIDAQRTGAQTIFVVQP